MDTFRLQIQLKILFWKSERFPLHVKCCLLYLWAEAFTQWHIRYCIFWYILYMQMVIFMFRIPHIYSQRHLKSSSSRTLFIHSQIRNLKSHFVWVSSHDVALNPCQAAAFEAGSCRTSWFTSFSFPSNSSFDVSLEFRRWWVDTSTPARFSAAFDVWFVPLRLRWGGFVPFQTGATGRKPAVNPDSGLSSVLTPGFWNKHLQRWSLSQVVSSSLQTSTFYFSSLAPSLSSR